MNIETIMQLVTILVTLILGVLSKKSPYVSNNIIPLQNIAIGLLMAVIEWYLTKDVSLAVALSGLCAGGTYDLIKNLLALKEPQKVVGDEPCVYEEIPQVEEEETDGIRDE